MSSHRMRRLALLGLALVVVAVGAVALVARPAGRSGATPSASAATSGASNTSSIGRLPASIDGEPVLLGKRISAHMAGSADDTPFLIGGVVTGSASATIECFYPTPPGADPTFLGTWLTNSCSSHAINLLSTEPGDTLSRYYLSPYHPAAPDVGKDGDVVVYRVHVWDPAAASCASDWQATCRAVMFIDALVWRNGVTL